MRRLAEPVAFLGLAAAVHAGVWLAYGGGGTPGSGPGGGMEAAPAALEIASPELAALVAAWDAPPEVAGIPPETALPEPGEPDATRLPEAVDEAALRLPPRPEAPALVAAMPDAPRLPEAAPPAPRPRVTELEAQDPAPRPRARPDPAERAAAAPAAPAAPRAPSSGTSAAARPEAAAVAPAKSAAGDGRPVSAAGLSAAQLRALEAEWGARIQARIARAQRYPRGESAEGTARVTLTVGRDGRLAAVALAASSGSASLDAAAVDAVRRAGRLPAAPEGLREASYRFALPVSFRRQ